MTAAQLATALTALGLGLVLGRLARTVMAVPASTPERAVAELRLSREAGLTLALIAGASLGIAATSGLPPATLDIVLAVGFFGVASRSAERAPRDALSLLAVAFLAHAVVDILHRPGGLAVGLIPRWYLVSCALFNTIVAGLCYLPLVRRER